MIIEKTYYIQTVQNLENVSLGDMCTFRNVSCQKEPEVRRRIFFSSHVIQDVFKPLVLVQTVNFFYEFFVHYLFLYMHKFTKVVCN